MLWRRSHPIRRVTQFNWDSCGLVHSARRCSTHRFGIGANESTVNKRCEIMAENWCRFQLVVIGRNKMILITIGCMLAHSRRFSIRRTRRFIPRSLRQLNRMLEIETYSSSSTGTIQQPQHQQRCQQRCAMPFSIVSEKSARMLWRSDVKLCVCVCARMLCASTRNKRNVRARTHTAHGGVCRVLFRK